MAARTRSIRWGAAITILVIGSFATAIGFFGEVCDEELSETGAVVELCDPPSVTDLPVTLALLALIAMLAPDLSEVTLGGIGVKRLIEQKSSETKQDIAGVEERTERRIAAFEMRVTQSPTFNNVMAFSPQLSESDIRGIVEALSRSRAEGGAGSKQISHTVDAKLISAQASAFANEWGTTEAILEWFEMARGYDRIGHGRPPGPLVGLDIDAARRPALIESLGPFVASSIVDFQVARSTRNILVHGDADAQPDDELLSMVTANLERFNNTVLALAQSYQQ